MIIITQCHCFCELIAFNLIMFDMVVPKRFYINCAENIFDQDNQL